MAVIYCPNCDSEIPENVTICPSCGFNLDTYDEEEETNTEFNALLNAANKKLNDDQSGQNGGSSAISQSQIDALLGGAVVDLTADEKSKAEDEAKNRKSSDEKKENANVGTGTEKADNTDAKESAETENAPSAETVKEISAVKLSGGKKKTGVKTKTNGVKPILVFIAVIAAAAIGFCISLFTFGDVIKTPEEIFAVQSAKALESTLRVNERLCVYKAYTRLGATTDECMIYAITEYKDVVTASKYRIAVNADDPSVVNIYYTIDENSPEYLALKNSADPEERIQASVLKNYSDGIESAHREISIGTPSWVSVDISEINSSLSSVTQNASE